MRRIIFAALISILGAGFAFSDGGVSKPCPMMARGKKCALCPEKMKGVDSTAKETANGVEITMTAGSKETIAKVREMALASYGSKDSMGADCPCRVEGAITRITDTETGAKVEITGGTPEIIRKIREVFMKERGMSQAAKGTRKSPAKKAAITAKYACPMGCATSDKPGKCPKCGMEMKETK